MAVTGGNTTSIAGRVAEIIGWFPSILGLLAVGSASFLDANHLVQLPAWSHSILDIYRGFRDHFFQQTMGKAVPANLADLGVAAVSLMTVVSRKILGFIHSIGGFVVLAAIAWFVLSKLG